MKRLPAKEIRALLEHHGFKSPTGLRPPRPSHPFKASPDIPLPSHTIWTKRLGAVWWGTVSLPDDCEKLTSLARETGECFYVFSGPVPSTRPFPRVAGRLLWWTKTVPADKDIFVSMDRYCPGKFELPVKNYRYPTGLLEEQAFFKWENMLHVGNPPEGAVAYGADFSKILIFADKSRRPTKPLAFHKSGPLELVWFDNGFPVWRKEYDIVGRHFHDAEFFKPGNLGLLRVENEKRLVALLFRAAFASEETQAAALSYLVELYTSERESR